MTPTDTVSLHDQAKRGTDPAERSLVLALDSARLTEYPWRVSLAGVDEVAIGRGPERSVRRQDRTLVITIPDVAVSALHARLRRAGAEWVVEDAQSKNGTFVNGEPATRARFSERDLLELGATFWLLRSGDSDVEPDQWDRHPQGLRTLCEPLARAFDLLSRVANSPVSVLLLGRPAPARKWSRAPSTISRSVPVRSPPSTAGVCPRR